MRDAMVDGRLQVTAALAMLQTSRLVIWDRSAAVFRPVRRDAFESIWQKEVHPVFGRVICWMVFSAGAELLAKGICLLRAIEIREDRDVPAYPRDRLDIWAHNLAQNPNIGETVTVSYYGTLGNLWNANAQGAGLKRLCLEAGASQQERDKLLAAYILLTRSIRNRDAHAYIPNVRDQHHSLVPDLFTEVFNLLISWIEGGGPTLNRWTDESREFIEQLDRRTDQAYTDNELKTVKRRLAMFGAFGSAHSLALRGEVSDAALHELKEFPALHNLILDGCRITDAGIRALKNLSTLRELHISSVPVTNAALYSIQKMGALVLLTINGTKVTPKGVNQLKAARPALHVVY